MSRLFHELLTSANPRHLPAFCCCTKGGGLPYLHGGRTRYRTLTIPALLDAFASQGWWTKCMLDLSLNGVVITSFDPSFLSVHYRTVDVLTRFRRPPGCFWDADRLRRFGVGTSCTMRPHQTGDPVSLVTSFPRCHSPTQQRRGPVRAIVSSSLGHFRPYRHYQHSFG